MVDSRFGRNDPAQVGQRRREPRALAEAENGDVRQPRALLALVDAEVLEPLEQVEREPLRTALLVVEDEHSDAAGLAVAADGEPPGRTAGRSRPERLRDAAEV